MMCTSVFMFIFLTTTPKDYESIFCNYYKLISSLRKMHVRLGGMKPLPSSGQCYIHYHHLRHSLHLNYYVVSLDAKETRVSFCS